MVRPPNHNQFEEKWKVDMHRTVKKTTVVGLAATAVVIFLGAAGCPGGGSNAQNEGQALTEQVWAASQRNPDSKYPAEAISQGGFTEMTLLAEALRRQSNPNTVRYVAVYLPMGQLLWEGTIQGMVFSTNSQMTTPQLVQDRYEGDVVVEAPGDNGSYGDEPFQYSAFDTAGAQHWWPVTAVVMQSDVPINATDKPLITFDPNATPRDTGGQADPRSILGR